MCVCLLVCLREGVQQWKVPAPEGMMLLLDSLPEYNAFAAGWNVLMDRIHAVEKRVLASFDMPWSDWSAFSALSRALGVNQGKRQRLAIHKKPERPGHEMLRDG